MMAMDSCTLAPETLANILRFLPARTLVNSLRVSRSWKNLAERELGQRKFFVSRVFKCSKDKRHSQSRAVEFREQVLEFLNDINIVPCAVLMSCCGIFGQMRMAQFRKWFMSKVTANLPKSCVVVGARGVGGVIGETEFGCPVAENDISPQLSLLCIPKAKGINVDLLQMTALEICGGSARWRNKLDHLVGKDIKFLFLIGGTSTCADYIAKIWANTSVCLGRKVVYAGGLGTPFASVDNKTTSRVVMGLAIGGNVEAANAYYDLRDGLDVKELVKKFPLVNQSRAEHANACILTPCVSLKQPLFDEETSRQFRKEFPLMKLFGFFGFGEIAMNSCRLLKDDEELTDLPGLYSFTISLSVLKFL